MNRSIKWLLAVVAAAVVALLIAVLSKAPPSASPLPVPNGHDDFLAAIPLLVPNAGFWPTQDAAELRSIVQQNSNALARIRTALGKAWQIPLQFDSNYITGVMTNLPSAKAAAQLFCAEGRLAELEHRTNDALRAFGDCIVFGQKSAAGGLMIQELVAIACKAIGMKEVRRLMPSVDATATRELLEKLSVVDGSGESAEHFIARDKDWSSRIYDGWRAAVLNLTMWKLLRESRERFRGRHKRSEAELRLLRVDAALRLHREEKEKYPTGLSELVPAYLDALPLDPFTGKPMIYRLTTNSYLLYSIGPDEIDDGGKPLTQSTGRGDLVSSPAAGN